MGRTPGGDLSPIKAPGQGHHIQRDQQRQDHQGPSASVRGISTSSIGESYDVMPCACQGDPQQEGVHR